MFIADRLVRHLLTENAKSSTTATKGNVELQNKRNSYRQRATKWREVQRLYMARFTTMHMTSGASTVAHNTDKGSPSSGTGTIDLNAIPKIQPFSVLTPETSALWMPSQLPTNIRDCLCEPGLANTELRLRLSILSSSLHHIRRQIRVRSALIRHKKTHVNGPGQKENVRSRQIISNITSKLNREVARYRRSFVAAQRLDPNGRWNVLYQELEDKDLRPPTQEEDSLGVGFRELSWIWRVQTLDQRDMPIQKDGRAVSNVEVHESV
jgi:hypothetical protein